MPATDTVGIGGTAPPRQKASKVRRILAFVVGAIWLVLTVPALGLAAMSVMASDGGVNAAIYTFIYACFGLAPDDLGWPRSAGSSAARRGGCGSSPSARSWPRGAGGGLRGDRRVGRDRAGDLSL